MTYTRGDIAIVFFPHSDLTTVKLRPVLVVQANDLNTGLPQVIVAMISSNMARAGHPSRTPVRLDPLVSRVGLRLDLVIMTDHLATIELDLFRTKIGEFTALDTLGQPPKIRTHCSG